MYKKLVRACKDPLWLLGVILRRYLSRFMSDRAFIRLEYLSAMGHFPNLKNPTTYNEKLQWLKLNDKHEEYSNLVDKLNVKEYISKAIGNQYVIPAIGGGVSSFDEIDFDSLPNQFVLKTTHDSGGVVVCSDKTKFDKVAARKKLERSLKRNYFYEHREYPYKSVQPRIFVEKYMVDESGKELKDYKFFVFNGKCKMLYIATDRPYNTHFDFYDVNFNHLPFEQTIHPMSSKTILKPDGFDEMINLAEKLGKGFPHVRIDLYNINGRIYFGEFTFFHMSGNVPFKPAEWDKKIGEWLVLPGDSSC